MRVCVYVSAWMYVLACVMRSHWNRDCWFPRTSTTMCSVYWFSIRYRPKSYRYNTVMLLQSRDGSIQIRSIIRLWCYFYVSPPSTGKVTDERNGRRNNLWDKPRWNYIYYTVFVFDCNTVNAITNITIYYVWTTFTVFILMRLYLLTQRNYSSWRVQCTCRVNECNALNRKSKCNIPTPWK